MIAGCYDLHLYCDGVGCTYDRDNYGRADAEFTGDETGAAARSRARRVGWKLLRDGRCLCPRCASAGTPPTPLDDPPTTIRRKVTAGRGGLAKFAERATPVIAPGEWSSARRARVVRRVSRMMKPRAKPVRAVDIDCPNGHAPAGTHCNGLGVGADLCVDRITAARAASRAARAAKTHG